MTTGELHGRLPQAIGARATAGTPGLPSLSSPLLSFPYPSQLRKKLQAVIADPETAEQAPLDDVEAEVRRARGDIIAQFLAEEGIAANKVDVIGLHRHDRTTRGCRPTQFRTDEAARVTTRAGEDAAPVIRPARGTR
jgi:1,6-anhydro-N-acetylmuramate kinase